MYYPATVVNILPDNHDHMNSCTVRVDNFHDDWDDEDLPTAHYLPNRSSFSMGGLRKDDRVLIEFEDNNTLAPIIKGVIPNKDKISKLYDVEKHYPEPYVFSDGNVLLAYEPNDKDPQQGKLLLQLGDNVKGEITRSKFHLNIGNSLLEMSEDSFKLNTKTFIVNCEQGKIKSSGKFNLIGNGIKVLGGSLIHLVASVVKNN